MDDSTASMITLLRSTVVVVVVGYVRLAMHAKRGDVR